MKIVNCLVLASAVLVGCEADRALPPALITGKALTPPAGPVQDVGSLPINLVLSPDGRYAISTDVGYRQWLSVIRVSDGVRTAAVEFSNKVAKGSANGETQASTPSGKNEKTNGLYYGLAITADGTVYAAQGAHDTIAILHLGPDGSLVKTGEIATRSDDFPTGVAVDSASHLYVTNQHAAAKDPFHSPGSVAIYDRATGRELGRYEATDSYGGTSNFPLAVVALNDGHTVFAGSERDGTVLAIDTSDPTKPALRQAIQTGSHPTGMALSANQKTLFVANSDSDTLTMVDTESLAVKATVLLRPVEARDLPGCSATSVALSSDGNTAYVTLSDYNAVAIVDIAAATVRGYVPTGWYPSSVIAQPDGNAILVCNAKGNAQRVPNMHLDEKTKKWKSAGSPLNLLEGNVQRIVMPQGDALAKTTRQVLKNNAVALIAHPPKNPLADIGIHSGNITHVFYIIKENRTYDQVLGDLPQGNGDPKLCLFPRTNTPNLHALAERFVLLDNLYAAGEVSGDGWCWSTESMANPYVSRNVPYHYSKRGRKFDFEGQNNGLPTGGTPKSGPDGEPITKDPRFANGTPPMPDVAEAPGGFIWDLCTQHHISFRNYGFFGYFADEAAGLVGGPENYPSSSGLQPADHDLAGLTDIDYKRFDMDFADSDATTILAAKRNDFAPLYKVRSFGRAKTTSRFAEWKREFDLALQRDPSGANLPAMTFIRLPNDHTTGAKANAHTPRSMVADNDYAVGQFVEAISHSPLWQHAAIFVIEDDAQSGADHVDEHRTTGFVISPFIKQASVDHRFYNTDSFLHTMELLLDLPPMTQYDATASVIKDWSTKPDNSAAYTPIMPPEEIIAEKNPEKEALTPTDPRYQLAVHSAAMDFSREDRAPADELNAIIWQTVHGPGSVVPRGHASSTHDD